MAVHKPSEDFLNNLNLGVSFPVTKQQIWQYDNLKKKLFNKDKKIPKLMDMIFTPTVNKNCDYPLNFSTVVDRKKFDRLKARHKCMNYTQLFQQARVNDNKNYFEKCRKFHGNVVYHYTEEKKYKNQVHPAKIRKCFQTILYKVLSQELIGNSSNKKKILKALHNLLLTAKTEPFNLIPLLKTINVQSMQWIKTAVDVETKYILIATFIKWLFQYFIVVIRYYFYITYIKEEKIFIFVEDWNKEKKEFLKKMNKKMVLEPVTNVNINSVENVSYSYLIPKGKGVRFITRHIYKTEVKQDLRKTLSVLKYLHETNFKNKDESSFCKKYVDIVEQKTKCSDEKVYIVLADIFDAYGSIKQEKLLEIIKSLFNNLPNVLILECYQSKVGTKYKFTNNSLRKTVPQTEANAVTKCYILEILENYIFNTKMIIDKKVFNLCKGIAQGLILSAALCDIYYGHMRKKYFTKFEMVASLFTYVDDSIFVTKNVFFANEYMQKIKNGIPEYNCWFNKLKLKTNLDVCKSDIIYLGWKINPLSLEIEPQCKTARYSTNFALLTYSSFETKLKYLASLKLSRLIFSQKVNSRQQIFKNIEIVAVQQAERSFALACALLNISKQPISIKTFHRANLKIIRKIEILSEWDTKERIQNRKKLLYIMWKSLHTVFNKKNIVFKNLIKEIRKVRKMYRINKKITN